MGEKSWHRHVTVRGSIPGTRVVLIYGLPLSDTNLVFLPFIWIGLFNRFIVSV